MKNFVKRDKDGVFEKSRIEFTELDEQAIIGIALISLIGRYEKNGWTESEELGEIYRRAVKFRKELRAELPYPNQKSE